VCNAEITRVLKAFSLFQAFSNFLTFVNCVFPIYNLLGNKRIALTRTDARFNIQSGITTTMQKLKTVRQFLTQYTEENDLAIPTILSYRNALNVFEKYHGGEVRFAELEKTIDKETGRQNGDLIINRWLSEYSKNVSPYTVKSRKAAILAILADAFDLRVTRYRKMRIKSPRCHDTPKDVWTPEEVRRLIEACDSLRGRFQSTQIRKKYYAQSLLMAAWDTGLRRADLLRIRWDWIKIRER